MREVNDAGRELVKAFEGIMDGDPSTVNLDPYLDPVGIWTIGWGHAIRGADGRFLRGQSAAATARALYPDGITLGQAEALLTADLLDACRDVVALAPSTVTDNQFAALVSFEFNCGGLRGSTLLKKLRAGVPSEGVAAQFGRWNKGRDPRTGQLVVLRGLTRRRAAEAALFLS